MSDDCKDSDYPSISKSEKSSTLSDPLKYLFEDWKMTKDRIKHFDNKLLQIRLQGIPIATGIQATGIGLSEYLFAFDSQLPLFSLIMLSSILYTIPIFLLDIFNQKLLKLSICHAICLEKKYFKDQLSITSKLTSPNLSVLNKVGGASVYIIIIGVGISLAIYGFQNS